jgi:tetratricopeptide (TPR) repeat protein
MKGDRYLSEKDYRGGIRSFRATLDERPDDALANYYMGRYLLALERSKEALPYLSQAAALKPNDADMRFWLGVAYWSEKDYVNERKSYQKALELDRVHLSAHVYLGHNYLDGGQAREALKHYDTALGIEPYQPEALYHRAAALGKLGDKQEETKAWKTYLDNYPDGALAREAARSLNALGDFTYRNHPIGVRRLTLDRIEFVTGTNRLSSESMPSLQVIGEVMSRTGNFDLEIESYYKGNGQLAEARGLAVKEFILNKYPDVSPSRLIVKSFAASEVVKTGNKVHRLDVSISFRSSSR